MVKYTGREEMRGYHIMHIMWYFSALQLHQTHTGQCLFIFLKACHRIHSGCFDRGMTQNISQSYNILFHTVKGKGK